MFGKAVIADVGSYSRSLARIDLNKLPEKADHQAIPIGTLTANLLGAFIIGMGFAWFNRMTHIDPMWKVLITT
ncbi:fluoride efflux transporter CrcB, partial [Salmonella enterica subsp. enterica serovar Kentucky]|nr:fluoride efflux transporter CrcB [Salmonella enterica subsp. enterica serovar Kentucky]